MSIIVYKAWIYSWTLFSNNITDLLYYYKINSFVVVNGEFHAKILCLVKISCSMLLNLEMGPLPDYSRIQ